jgi:hypothetical protein
MAVKIREKNGPCLPVAALALLEWHLITADPPLPKSNWASSRATTQLKDKLIEDAKSKSSELAAAFRHATCLASDDRRLAK